MRLRHHPWCDRAFKLMRPHPPTEPDVLDRPGSVRSVVRSPVLFSWRWRVPREVMPQTLTVSPPGPGEGLSSRPGSVTPRRTILAMRSSIEVLPLNNPCRAEWAPDALAFEYEYRVAQAAGESVALVRPDGCIHEAWASTPEDAVHYLTACTPELELREFTN